MRFRIPLWYDRALDWLSSWLPPPKPIGLKIRGYTVTWLDVFVVVVWMLVTIGVTVYYGHWIWAVYSVLAFVLTIILFGWL